MLSQLLFLFVGGAVGSLVPKVTAWYKAKYAKVAPVVQAGISQAKDKIL
jgi:hypothetical protein